MSRSSLPIRIISSILIAAFLIQDIAFANPDIGRAPQDALQIPLRYAYPTKDNILQDTLQYILLLCKDKDLKDLNLRLTPRVRDDVRLSIDFKSKYRESPGSEEWVVPCSVGYGPDTWSCEAVVRPDKTFRLRAPGQKESPKSLPQTSPATEPAKPNGFAHEPAATIPVNDILKRFSWKGAELSEALSSADLSAVVSSLKDLSLAATYQDPEVISAVSDEARSSLIAKALAVSLGRKDAKEVAIFLESLLKEDPAQYLPEALMFIRSYLAVFRIDRPISMAVTVSLYKTQDKYPDKPEGHGWFSAKTEQFFAELLSVNPLVNGFFVFVNDGDDSAEYGKKTSDVLRGLLGDERYKDIRDRVHILELSQEDRVSMGSMKHGAIACGMRYAVDNGADVVFYTDSDLSAHLGLLGLLTDSIINKGNGLAFGSIEVPGAVATGRSFKRSFGTLLYNLWVRAILKQVRGIHDTQRSFKGFARDLLESILPVEIMSVNRDGLLDIYYDRDFNYDFTGDTEWLGRAKIAGYSIDEIPIVWVDMPEVSSIKFGRDALKMFVRVWRERLNFEIFSKKDEYLKEEMIAPLPVDPAVSSGRLARRYERSAFNETIFFADGNEISVEFDPDTREIKKEVITDRMIGEDGKARILSRRVYGPSHDLEKATWYDQNEKPYRTDTAEGYQLFQGDAARWVDINEYNAGELLRKAVGVRYLTPEVESDIEALIRALFDSDIPEFINALRYHRAYPALCGDASQYIYERLRDRKISAELVMNGAAGDGVHYVVKVNLGGEAFLIDGIASQFESIPRDKKNGMANTEPAYLYRNTGLVIIPASVARNLPYVDSVYIDRKRGSLITRSFNAKTGEEKVVDVKVELSRLSPKTTSKNLGGGDLYLGMNLFIPRSWIRPDGGLNWAAIGAFFSPDKGTSSGGGKRISPADLRRSAREAKLQPIIDDVIGLCESYYDPKVMTTHNMNIAIGRLSPMRRLILKLHYGIGVDIPVAENWVNKRYTYEQMAPVLGLEPQELKAINRRSIILLRTELHHLKAKDKATEDDDFDAKLFEKVYRNPNSALRGKLSGIFNAASTAAAGLDEERKGAIDEALLEAVYSFVKNEIMFGLDEWKTPPSDTIYKGYGAGANKARVMVRIFRIMGLDARYIPCKIRPFAALWETLADVAPGIRPQTERLLARRDMTHLLIRVYLPGGRQLDFDPSLDSQLANIVSGRGFSAEPEVRREDRAYPELYSFVFANWLNLGKDEKQFMEACNNAIAELRTTKVKEDMHSTGATPMDIFVNMVMGGERTFRRAVSNVFNILSSGDFDAQTFSDMGIVIKEAIHQNKLLFEEMLRDYILSSSALSDMPIQRSSLEILRPRLVFRKEAQPPDIGSYMPTLKAIMKDGRVMRRFIFLLTALREAYKYDMDREKTTPLQYADENNISLSLNELNIVPVNNFPNRFIIFSLNGDDKRAIELVLPAVKDDPADLRLISNAKVASRVRDRSPHVSVARPIFSLRLKGVFLLHGSRVSFDDDPLVVDCFEYRDGIPVSVADDSYIDLCAERRGVSAEALRGQIKARALSAAFNIHEAGYVYSGGRRGSLGMRNLRLTSEGDVEYVGNFGMLRLHDKWAVEDKVRMERRRRETGDLRIDSAEVKIFARDLFRNALRDFYGVRERKRAALRVLYESGITDINERERLVEANMDIIDPRFSGPAGSVYLGMNLFIPRSWIRPDGGLN
ncbi:MAG TPA: hypothetical protein PLV52_00845, partial [Candidatus Omnitrophota bacterium]|nr:hypothetical protein [Candidatus Omnitrophota bacterium]